MKNNQHPLPEFPTQFEAILQRVAAIDPITYGVTRNYIDGAVSYLSPYISRGVISTKWITQQLIKRGYTFQSIEKFIQELAWRDYWQRVWQEKGSEINHDMRHPQHDVRTHEISTAITNATTGIQAVDDVIKAFYQTGYLHNHLRMYIASIACNIGQNYWKHPAQWMYYHLLDGDWASNALSWQWVAGTNSHKKYYANQENINKYCHTAQSGTFLDVSYDSLPGIAVPEKLMPTEMYDLKTTLPSSNELQIDDQLPTFIYNAYNLDPQWQQQQTANRILLLEPSHFEAYPMAPRSIDFILALSKNIPQLQVFVGEFEALKKMLNGSEIHFKEHPLNKHYEGIKISRDWMTSVEGYYPSFFKFWKRSKKELQQQFSKPNARSASEEN